jgi:hypothetical protein
MVGERGFEPPTPWSRMRAKFIDSVSFRSKKPLKKASGWTQSLDPTAIRQESLLAVSSVQPHTESHSRAESDSVFQGSFVLLTLMASLSAIVLMLESSSNLGPLGEWPLKIVEIYMTWYTFFLSSNIIVMGWIFGTKIDDSVKKMLRPICWLFIVLNLFATASSIDVGWVVYPSVPNGSYKHLIFWAAFANAAATVGFAVVWRLCSRNLKTP